MKTTILISIAILLFSQIPSSYSEELELFTNDKVYAQEQPLFVYGNALPNENLIIRLFAPDETISKFDQITTNEDGSFSHVLLMWPESSTDFPYGTYTIEIISTEQGLSQTMDVRFATTDELVEVPVTRNINTLVFAPETAAINQPIRVFVQTTSDGLLVGNDPQKFLDTTHVHLPSGKVQSITDSFNTLHQGLYFADYTPTEEGTYVFHVVAFNQGTISHGSAATAVLKQDIGGISDQIITLNQVLEETSNELDKLRSEVDSFGSTLESASTNIDQDVDTISDSVGNIQEASTQLNSLLFPIVASVGIIVALQIAILARRR